MSVSGSGQSPSFNFSIASSPLDLHEDMENVNIKNYVKDMLRSRIFLGRYVERRLVNQRIGYRDIVIVSEAEVELKRDLTEAQHKLRSIYPNTHWIGITDVEPLGMHTSGVCLWTEIENEPLGPFWFQIKSLKFREHEIIVTLKCLRHISDSYLELEPILTGSGKKTKVCENKLESSVATLNETYNDTIGTLKSALTISNLKELVTFLFAFIIAIFTGSTAFVNFLGNFILALIRETSVLIKNSTPLFLGFLDFLSKIAGGFYILIAMFFRPSNPVPFNKRSVTYYDRNQRHDNEQFDSRYID